MDKIYRRKLLKMAIATPLALSVALVLDIDPGLAFLGPLMVFNTIWLLPDPVGLKRFLVLKQLYLFLPMFFAAAFVAGLWGINSIVIFLFILLAAWGLQTWEPSSISFGLLSPLMFLAMTVLNSSAPYTTTVYLLILLAISMGLGWLVERLFWPIFDQHGIERQLSEMFRIFQDLSDLSFQRTPLNTDGGDSSLKALTVQANSSMRAINKALKTAAMTSSLPISERDAWAQALTVQARLLAHLLALSRLLQDNRENPLLNEPAPELSVLGDSLSATFAGLSVAIVEKQPGRQLPSPHLDFKRWQSQLNRMRAAGTTQSYDLASCLAVGLIEHRLEGLISETSKIMAWLETRHNAVSKDLLIELETA